MKIKVDAELYDALLWGAEVMQAQITMEELTHEATRKAYMMLTAAHDQATLANELRWVNRTTTEPIVGTDLARILPISVLQQKLAANPWKEGDPIGAEYQWRDVPVEEEA